MVAAVELGFPRGLLWGAGCSAYQVEAGLANNDWWAFEHAPGSPVPQPCMDGIDHARRYGEDLKVLATLGLTLFRMSLEWSAIEPAPGHFSKSRLAHYRAVLLACHQLGLTPVVALHHYTTPNWLSACGGWQHHEAATLFVRYAAAVMRALGDYIPYALPITALNLPGLWSSRSSVRAPSFFHGDDAASQQHVLEAQTRAADVIRMISPCVRVGASLVLCDEAQPLSSWQPWLGAMGSCHFVELRLRTREGQPNDALAVATAQAMAAAQGALPKSVEWLVSAGAGIRQADEAGARGRLHAVLAGVHQAVHGGAPLRGMLYPAAFDQYEWMQGYGRRRGLVAVHPETLVRTVRPLARWYGSVSRTGVLPAAAP